MSNFKRRKPKTYDYPTCLRGMGCPYDIQKTRTNNSKLRHTHKDYRQPQWYTEEDEEDLQILSMAEERYSELDWRSAFKQIK